MSEELSAGCWMKITKWGYFAADTVGKQLIRAVDSVRANMAESYGRYHYPKSMSPKPFLSLRAEGAAISFSLDGRGLRACPEQSEEASEEAANDEAANDEGALQEV